MRYFIHWLQSPGTANIQLHQNACVFFPDPLAVEFLGDFDSSHEAQHVAKQRFGDIHGCRYCCPECNTASRSGHESTESESE